jgi:hypothetical protein
MPVGTGVVAMADRIKKRTFPSIVTDEAFVKRSRNLVFLPSILENCTRLRQDNYRPTPLDRVASRYKS